MSESNPRTAVQADHLDVAYIALGAKAALQAMSNAAYDTVTGSALGTGGECDLIADVIGALIGPLTDAWAEQGGEWSGGCWAYEVCEPLGGWWVGHLAAHDGAAPSEREVLAMIGVTLKAAQ